MITALGKILPPQSREQNDQAWIQQTRDSYVKTAAAFGIVVVRDATDNGQRITGGRLCQRLHLAAINLGLAMQPLNQITERIDRERLLGLNPRFTQGGRSTDPRTWLAIDDVAPRGVSTVDAPLSPRRRAETVILQ